MSKKNEYRQNDDGSYVIQKNKKGNVIAFVLCFFVAFCIWIYVMNMENGDYSKTLSLSIEVVGEEELYAKTGLKIFEDSTTVSTVNITVQGTKADVQKYKEQDFRAYINVSDLTESGKASLGIHVETPTSAVKVISTDPTTVKVTVDYEKSKEVPLRVHRDPRITCSADMQTITVKGPQDYVNQIEYVQVSLPNDEYTTGDTVVINSMKVFNDRENLISNLNLTFLPETVTVTVLTVEEEDA